MRGRVKPRALAHQLSVFLQRPGCGVIETLLVSITDVLLRAHFLDEIDHARPFLGGQGLDLLDDFAGGHDAEMFGASRFPSKPWLTAPKKMTCHTANPPAAPNSDRRYACLRSTTCVARGVETCSVQ
jgi:hypothetical protein